MKKESAPMAKAAERPCPISIMKYIVQLRTLMVFDILEKNTGIVAVGKYGRENGR